MPARLCVPVVVLSLFGTTAFAQPVLLSPPQGAIMDNGCSDFSNPIVQNFAWAPVAGAQLYNLYVIGPTASIPAIDVTLGATGYHSVYTGGYVDPGAALGWRFKVRVMVGGIWSAFSPERTFDIEMVDTDCQQAEPTVSVNDVTVTEGDAGPKSAVFTLSLSAPRSQTVSVFAITSEITATAGVDFVFTGPSLVTFDPGVVTQTFTVPVTGDSAAETNETFQVTLYDAANGSVADGTGIGTIVNDDLAPFVTTNSPTTVTDSTATLNATVNPNTFATNAFFEYGPTSGYGRTTAATSLVPGSLPVAVSVPVTDLACNSLHHVRAVATNSEGTTYGGDLIFATASCPPPPTVTTNAVTDTTQTGALLKGTINPEGGATKRRFEYGPTLAYGSISPDLAIGNGSSALPVSFVATGLACNTLHHYRAVGQNSGGTTNGSDLTFTTAACPAAADNNISAATAQALTLDSASRDSMSNVRAEIWYRVRLFGSRSYQFSVWPVDHEQRVDAPVLELGIFSDDAGTLAATPAPVISSAALEGSPNSSGDSLPASLLFQPTATSVYKVRVLRTGGGTATHSVNVAVRETTLFSPWTSRAAGFEGFIEMHNNTNAAISVTLRGFDNTGTLQGAGLTITLQPNATDFRTANQIGVPVNVFAGIVLTHDRAFGAVSANITTLNGANGLSFDSPFTPRDGTLSAFPIR